MRRDRFRESLQYFLKSDAHIAKIYMEGTPRYGFNNQNWSSGATAGLSSRVSR
jgi:hypothetical protein